MRFILGSAIVVVATALLCHGLFLEDQARTALGDPALVAPSSLTEGTERWRYSEAAAVARELRIRAGDPIAVLSAERSLMDSVRDTLKAGIRDVPPYLQPPVAGLFAVMFLALAVLFPKTRFRGSALLLLILAVLVLYPGFAESPRQSELAKDLDFLVPAMAEMPRIAAGLLLLSGLVFGAETRRRRSSTGGH